MMIVFKENPYVHNTYLVTIGKMNRMFSVSFISDWKLY